MLSTGSLYNKLVNRFIVYYFGFLVFFFSFFASGFFDSSDGFQYLTVARRIYYDHTIKLPEESFENGKNIHLNATVKSNGDRYPVTGLGYTLALLPAVAVEDFFLDLAKIEPIKAFPLENDWPVLLFGSMVNSVFAALLVCIFYLFFKELGLNHNQSVFLSFILFVSSNLFVYAKHTFAHLMFTSFLFLTFYLVKAYSRAKNSLYMYWAGTSFGVVTIIYNQTFALAAPALVIYYLLLTGLSLKKKYFIKTINNLCLGIVGYLPFLLIFQWFNSMKSGVEGLGYIAKYAVSEFSEKLYAYQYLEGFWGMLFSPGRSIFIYSPTLLGIFIFWFKLKKQLMPELITGIILFFSYFWFIGTFVWGNNEHSWHGELSWGPRYLLPTLPLLLLIAGVLFMKSTKFQKIVVWIPLIVIGIYVQLISLVLPYQIKFRGLEQNVVINERTWELYEYGNFLPTYSPVFIMTKQVYYQFKQQLYDSHFFSQKARLTDGFSGSMRVNNMAWREMYSQSEIKMKSLSTDSIESIDLKFKNVNTEASDSGNISLSFYLNEQQLHLAEEQSQIFVGEEKEIRFNQLSNIIHSGVNNLKILQETKPDMSSKLASDSSSLLIITRLSINDQPQNIALINYPYVSVISKSLFDYDYGYWGGEHTDAWDLWYMRSSVYENTFDFWWLRPFQFWDLPKDFYLGLFIFNFSAMCLFGWLAFFSVAPKSSPE